MYEILIANLSTMLWLGNIYLSMVIMNSCMSYFLDATERFIDAH
jgi:hypothetical protein